MTPRLPFSFNYGNNTEYKTPGRGVKIRVNVYTVLVAQWLLVQVRLYKANIKPNNLMQSERFGLVT